MSLDINQIVDNLKAIGEERFEKQWQEYLFNIPMAQQLLGIDQASATEVLSAGINWSGTGWTTSSAARTLYNLTAETLVSSDPKAYLMAWLYALSMVWQVEDALLTVTDVVAKASFTLSSLITTEEHPHGAQVPVETSSQMVMDWEDRVLALPPDLAYLFDKSRAGHRLQLKTYLDDLPDFAGLPARAPENNHGGDGKGGSDRLLRSLQQQVLHAIRFYTACYVHLLEDNADDSQRLFQQGYHALCDAYHKAEDARKEQSIPGPTACQQKEVLFNKEDLDTAKLNQSINLQRKLMYSPP